ncbi:hypothetical protein K493DRAFT_318657 [Basidiobolus meristosporus CBS 931.73]|uniref:LITAF domain-containing protein n=1 Tax=Basidiobolus meristosporus CBS 931.73 TaxID=1314790 RepID=A0A1Y1XUS8_9FUNG|nr:hypothetical protein K493DRAFT_318657 [Basidiobolus meristosporus CBS 931.73]|eukprot:ORX89473.1 hypothetical protein K493DRAFT_318657 [Basidiobolus meristosporus CBS 931.73]
MPSTYYKDPLMRSVSSASLPAQPIPPQSMFYEQGISDSRLSSFKHHYETISPPRPSLETDLPPSLRRFHSLCKTRLRDSPLRIQCPGCHNYCTTNLKFKNGSAVWLSSLGLFMLTGIFFWVPFITHMCKDVVHVCPNCQYPIGRYRRL